MQEKIMSEKEKQSQDDYRVLARKYRPQNFDDLIGQEPLVRTLKNAIETGRIAHAFMLTGIRGVGKTTTARIIAKALNYTGADGKAGPTTGNMDDCETCKAIAEDRHPDVIEMDAASRTGVDDIREIIDGVRYAPTSARYKVYIIDEVHMLSKNAFNALLKTLEEPPAHVKFIFATTEIRKVPVTVLSRCQRFDLRRITLEDLEAHFKKICGLENVEAEDEAITLVAKAADGSVRDGLSILDQAIALSNDKITTDVVSNMLGLSDGAQSLDLFEAALTGKPQDALAIMESLYTNGADPALIIEDMLNITHAMTKVRVLKDAADLSVLPYGAQERGKALAYQLSMPALSRSWQILVKGLNEVRLASQPQKAAEMVLIRLVYAAELPDPLDLIKKIESGELAGSNAAEGGAPSQRPPSTDVAPNGGGAQLRAISGGGGSAQAQPQASVQHQAQSQTQASPVFASMLDVVEFLRPIEVRLAGELFEFARPVKVNTGVIEFALKDPHRTDIVNRLQKAMRDHLQTPPKIVVSKDSEAATLSELEQKSRDEDFRAAEKHEGVRKIIELFPGAELKEILYDDEQ